jgi:hypothetical protein
MVLRGSLRRIPPVCFFRLQSACSPCHRQPLWCPPLKSDCRWRAVKHKHESAVNNHRNQGLTVTPAPGLKRYSGRLSRCLGSHHAVLRRFDLRPTVMAQGNGQFKFCQRKTQVALVEVNIAQTVPEDTVVR